MRTYAKMITRVRIEIEWKFLVQLLRGLQYPLVNRALESGKAD